MEFSEPQTVLVVDDEPFILRSLTYVLQKEGFRVLEAHDGEEGLLVAKREKPSLILLDIMMPKRDGYDVLRALRKDGLLEDIRVILLTAKGQDSDRREGMELGACEYMTKPFSPQKVVERARALLSTTTKSSGSTPEMRSPQPR